MPAEIKLSIQKLKNKSKIKTKIINDYSKLIQTIKKEYQLLAKENENLKTRLQKAESYKNQQQLIQHNKKAMKYFPQQQQHYDNRKRKYKLQIYGSSSSSSSGEENFEY